MKQLILASQSPRRRELLALCGYPFEVVSPSVSEKEVAAEVLATRGMDEPFLSVCERLVEALALAKAKAVDGEVVVASDTVVVLGETVLGKPADEAEAVAMLRTLAGNTHHVLTGVAIVSAAGVETFVTSAAVTFWPLDSFMEALISEYAASGAPLDKAGAYGIQDRGALLVSEISGDYYTVVGLPVGEVARRLARVMGSWG